MILNLTTPEKVVAENRPINGVFVETDAGPIAILDHHASLISTSKLGNLRVVAGKETDAYLLRNAIIQMDNGTNTLNVTALSCEETSEVTNLDLANYLEYLQNSLSDQSVVPGSLQYSFLQGEKIAVERKVNKK